MKVSQMSERKSHGESILIYGSLGTGKTGTYSQIGPFGYCIDFDAGLRTALCMEDHWSQWRKELEFDTFYDPIPLKAQSFTQARNHLINNIVNPLRAGKKPKNTSGEEFNVPLIWIMDSLSGLSDAVINSIKSVSKNPNRNPSMEEWGIILNEIREFLGLFRGLPGLKLLIAHDMPVEDADGVTKWKVNCPGRKLPAQVLGLFDDVFYSSVKKVAGGKMSYTLTSTSTCAIEVRTRSRFKGDYEVDKGFAKFLSELGYLSESELASYNSFFQKS